MWNGVSATRMHDITRAGIPNVAAAPAAVAADTVCWGYGTRVSE